MAFTFCYNCLLKLALAICAKNNLRVKADRGHHIALIKKMADLLEEKEIETKAQAMRTKRNKDLYGGGVLVTKKETETYLQFVADLIKKVEKYLDFGKLL